MKQELNDSLTISEYILQELKKLECNHIIGIPGTNCAAFFDTIDKTKGIKYIIPTSELEAGYIADGYARNGQIAALCVAYGVGTLSLANPLAGAYAEKLPMILINGGPTTEEEAIENKHNSIFLHSTGTESSDYNVFKHITAYSTIIKHPNEAKAKIDEALKIAVEKSQPVYLEIPSDFWDLPIDADQTGGDMSYFISELKKTIINKAKDKAINFDDFKIKDSLEKVIFIVGPEITRNGLSQQFLDFIIANNLSFMTTPFSKSFEGVISDEVNIVHYENKKSTEIIGKPNYWGCLDNITFISESKAKFINEAQYFLCIGNIWGVDSKKFVVDNYSKMIEIAYGEARIGYKKFNNIGDLPKVIKGLNEVFKINHSDLKASLDELKLQIEKNKSNKPKFSQDNLFKNVKSFIQDSKRSPNLLFNVDACLAMFWGTEIKLKEKDQYISNPAWLSIGHSAPSSIGHYLKNGLPPLIIAGDGGFQMVSQTYSTMIKLGIPALIIVVNNSILGIEEFLLDPKQKRNKPFDYTLVRAWDYHEFPSIYNSLEGKGQGFKTRTEKDLNDILDKWSTYIKTNKSDKKFPWIVNCIVDSKSIPSRIAPEKPQSSNSLLPTFKLR